jgi:virginiamycin B lyase
VIRFWPAVAVAFGLGLGVAACTFGDSETLSPATTQGAGEAHPETTAPLPRRTTTAPGGEPAGSGAEPIPAPELELVAFPVPAGSRPHDVAPADDGGVWYSAQAAGELGWLDPETGETRHVSLGAGSRPHGVIVGPGGDAWLTDGGLNAIVRVGATSGDVEIFPLPDDRPDANLNTAAFDAGGQLWFTGQNGIHGVLDPASGRMEVYDSPGGRGPYGITATPIGEIYYASLAGSYVGSVAADGSVTVLEPPTAGQGARRVWSDSAGSIWVSEWNAGQLSRYVPATGAWTSWPLPGEAPQAYAVYVDDTDIVWTSDFGGNAIHRFDPGTETFTTFELPSERGEVRQILGRPGEVWGAESAADQLVVIRRAAG